MLAQWPLAPDAKIDAAFLKDCLTFKGTEYRLIRTRTKQRMKRRLKEAYIHYLQGKLSAHSMDQRLQSYLGTLSHSNQASLSQALKNAYWMRAGN